MQLLPAAFQPSVSVGQAGQVNPLAYVTLVNHQLAVNAAEVDREIARQEIQRRHAGKPLGPLWRLRDNLALRPGAGARDEQVHTQTLTQLTRLHAQQQQLVGAMAEGLIDGTTLAYQQPRLAHDHREQVFARSLDADERDRAHAYQKAELDGEQRLTELKLQIEADQTSKPRPTARPVGGPAGLVVPDSGHHRRTGLPQGRRSSAYIHAMRPA